MPKPKLSKKSPQLSASDLRTNANIVALTHAIHGPTAKQPKSRSSQVATIPHTWEGLHQLWDEGEEAFAPVYEAIWGMKDPDQVGRLITNVVNQEIKSRHVETAASQILVEGEGPLTIYQRLLISLIARAHALAYRPQVSKPKKSESTLSGANIERHLFQCACRLTDAKETQENIAKYNARVGMLLLRQLEQDCQAEGIDTYLRNSEVATLYKRLIHQFIFADDFCQGGDKRGQFSELPGGALIYKMNVIGEKLQLAVQQLIPQNHSSSSSSSTPVSSNVDVQRFIQKVIVSLLNHAKQATVPLSLSEANASSSAPAALSFSLDQLANPEVLINFVHKFVFNVLQSFDTRLLTQEELRYFSGKRVDVDIVAMVYHSVIKPFCEPFLVGTDIILPEFADDMKQQAKVIRQPIEDDTTVSQSEGEDEDDSRSDAPLLTKPEKSSSILTSTTPQDGRQRRGTVMSFLEEADASQSEPRGLSSSSSSALPMRLPEHKSPFTLSRDISKADVLTYIGTEQQAEVTALLSLAWTQTWQGFVAPLNLTDIDELMTALFARPELHHLGVTASSQTDSTSSSSSFTYTQLQQAPGWGSDTEKMSDSSGSDSELPVPPATQTMRYGILGTDASTTAVIQPPNPFEQSLSVWAQLAVRLFLHGVALAKQDKTWLAKVWCGDDKWHLSRQERLGMLGYILLLHYNHTMRDRLFDENQQYLRQNTDIGRSLKWIIQAMLFPKYFSEEVFTTPLTSPFQPLVPWKGHDIATRVGFLQTSLQASMAQFCSASTAPAALFLQTLAQSLLLVTRYQACADKARDPMFYQDIHVTGAEFAKKALLAYILFNFVCIFDPAHSFTKDELTSVKPSTRDSQAKLAASHSALSVSSVGFDAFWDACAPWFAAVMPNVDLAITQATALAQTMHQTDTVTNATASATPTSLGAGYGTMSAPPLSKSPYSLHGKSGKQGDEGTGLITDMEKTAAEAEEKSCWQRWFCC